MDLKKLTQSETPLSELVSWQALLFLFLSFFPKARMFFGTTGCLSECIIIISHISIQRGKKPSFSTLVKMQSQFKFYSALE